MKTSKKKLSLNKTTLRALTPHDLSEVAGGTTIVLTVGTTVTTTAVTVIAGCTFTFTNAPPGPKIKG